MIEGMITALALLGLISLIAGACRWLVTDAGDASARQLRPKVCDHSERKPHG